MAQLRFQILLGLWKISVQWHAWAAVLLDAVIVFASLRNCGLCGVVLTQGETAGQDASQIPVVEIIEPLLSACTRQGC